MDDIDRIEVISGPGATLWGANAMNGVINIITRQRAGNRRRTAARQRAATRRTRSARRYGGIVGDGDAFRVYAKGFDRGPTRTRERRERRRSLAQGAGAVFAWTWARPATRTASPCRATTRRRPRTSACSSDVGFTQLNVLGRWEHTGERVSTRLQVYYRSHRARQAARAASRSTLDTYDIEFQQIAERRRTASHRLGPGPPLQRIRHRQHAVAALRAAIAHARAHQCLRAGHHPRSANTSMLTAGIKFEDNSYSGWATLPDLRLSWAPNDRHAGVGRGGARDSLTDAVRRRRARGRGRRILVVSAIRISRPEKSERTSSATAASRILRFPGRSERVPQRVRRPAHDRGHARRVPSAALGQPDRRLAPTAWSSGRTGR